jgi:hypothetical protein
MEPAVVEAVVNAVAEVAKIPGVNGDRGTGSALCRSMDGALQVGGVSRSRASAL